MVKSYVKSIKQVKDRMAKLEEQYNFCEKELEELLEKEAINWVKKYECEICSDKSDTTEWHHIISQHRCKEEGLEHMIKMRSNVIELCKPCHDLTTASLLRKNMPDNRKVSEDNEASEPTEKQLNYIKKLGGAVRDDLTRKGASLFIDELKKVKSDQTQTL